MDVGRRELYVEGVRDRVFLNWLVGDTRDTKASIVPIDQVELPEVDLGGNRERLKVFLQQVVSQPANIRGLIDTDHATFIEEAFPPNAWMTDLRDIEGYVLSEENVDAALRLGYGIDRVAAVNVLASTHEVGATLASIRLGSEKLGLKLPVSSANLSRCSKATRNGQITLDVQRLLQSLLQAAGISLGRLPEVTTEVAVARELIATFPIEQVIHGKDCMKILTLQFKALGSREVADAAPVLWSSFKREKLTEYPVLNDIVTFLTKA